MRKLNKNMAVISALSDLPNATDGLSAAKFKEKFDENGIAIKTYINNELIPDIETLAGTKENSSDITNKRKLDENGNFTGSWFGLKNPIASEPGIQNQVYNLTEQLSQTVFLYRDDVTLKIPSDFQTLQEAVDFVSEKHVKQGKTITLLIEPGHKLLDGINVKDGDYSFIRVTSADEVVYLDNSFPLESCIIKGVNAKLPTLACLVDGESTKGRNGYYALDGSVGFIEEFCGVKNIGGTGDSPNGAGCFVQANSAVAGVKSIFTGNKRNLWVTMGSNFRGEYGDYSGAIGDRAIFASRGSVVNIPLSKINNSAQVAINIFRSRVVAMGSEILNSGEDAVYCSSGSIFSGESRHEVITRIENSGNNGLVVDGASSAFVNYAVIKNSAGNNLVAQNASNISAKGAEIIGANANGVLCSDSSNVAVDEAIIKENGRNGCFARRGGTISARLAQVIDNLLTGMYAEGVSTIDAEISTVINSGEWGVRGYQGGRINIVNGEVKGSQIKDIVVNRGSTIIASACKTTNSSGTAPIVGDTNVVSFNQIQGSQGTIWV